MYMNSAQNAQTLDTVKKHSTSAIDRVLLKNGCFRRHYGDDYAKQALVGLRNDHRLDPDNDQPMPKWATDLLRDSRIGYRLRVRIVLTHQYDLTGDVSCQAETYNAPKRKPPTWLSSHRDYRRDLAKKYLIKKGILREPPSTNNTTKQNTNQEKR